MYLLKQRPGRCRYCCKELQAKLAAMVRHLRSGQDPQASFCTDLESNSGLPPRSRVTMFEQLSCVSCDIALAVKLVELRSRWRKRGQLATPMGSVLIAAVMRHEEV